jgi:hypothetical protein
MSKPKRTFNHGDRETRRRKALERLGTDDPKCLICSECDPIALELHHIAKTQFSDETVPLCSTHHDKVSDAAKDRPPKIDGCTSPLEGLGHLVFGLAELLAAAPEDLRDTDLGRLLAYIIRKLNEMGHFLIEQARATHFSESGDLA